MYFNPELKMCDMSIPCLAANYNWLPTTFFHPQANIPHSPRGRPIPWTNYVRCPHVIINEKAKCTMKHKPRYTFRLQVKCRWRKCT
jgi:hypothetical protein